MIRITDIDGQDFLVVLTYDVPDEHEGRRKGIEQELADQGWESVDGLSTVWTCRIKGHHETDAREAGAKRVAEVLHGCRRLLVASRYDVRVDGPRKV